MIAVRKSDSSDVYQDLRELNPDAYVAKGMSEAYIGHSHGDRPIAVYDYDECVSIMMEKMSLSQDDAERMLKLTMIPELVGENLPVFVVVKQ